MINQDKWVGSLPKSNIKSNNEKNDQIDHYRWVDTIAKKNTFNAVGKYSLMIVLFVCGLLFVSAIKNETRNLEKEISDLRASNSVIRFNLEQAILDNEVITSPENISKLAREYLNGDFVFYKKSQIRQLGDDVKTTAKLNKENNDFSINKPNKKNNKLSKKIKLKIVKKIEKKKTEIMKLQQLYSQPQSLPSEIKVQVAKKIKEKKTELKKLYNSPKEIITLEKAQTWAAVQVVKVFFGIPIVPGR